MELEDIVKQIENVSKKEIKIVAPKDCDEIKGIILNAKPVNMYEKMILGYLTSLCAEYTYPETFHLERNDLDYIGFELDKGSIEVEVAGNMLGTCMRGGRIVAKKAGEETGSSMAEGEIIAEEIKGIGSTTGGRISTNKAGRISKAQGAKIFISGVRFKRSLLDRLFG